MKRCVIIGAVEIDFPAANLIRDTDFVICADRGWQNALKMGIKPDMIVGDFDSHENPHLDTETIVLPCEKDDTDTVFAVGIQ